MTATYAPIIVAIGVALGMGGLFTLFSVAFGPKHLTAEKLAPFECGSEPIGSPRVRFSVKFYQVAILFLVFDIETAFLYPWAVLYRKLSCTSALAMSGVCTGNVTFFGFAEMLTFVVILVVALAYTWRKKAIGWG